VPIAAAGKTDAIGLQAGNRLQRLYGLSARAVTEDIGNARSRVQATAMISAAPEGQRASRGLALRQR
jgi:hypothetical protein